MYYTPANLILQGHSRSNDWHTVNGYDRESKRLATCIIRTKQNYTWHVTLNIKSVLGIKEVKATWKQISRKLKKTITALWIREPNKEDHVNYHLLIANEISEQILRDAIITALPSALPFSYTIRPYHAGVAFYITKAGNYKTSRCYFAPHTSLSKHGTIGKFWLTPKKLIWQQVINQ